MWGFNVGSCFFKEDLFWDFDKFCLLGYRNILLLLSLLSLLLLLLDLKNVLRRVEFLGVWVDLYFRFYSINRMIVRYVISS